MEKNQLFTQSTVRDDFRFSVDESNWRILCVPNRHLTGFNLAISVETIRVFTHTKKIQFQTKKAYSNTLPKLSWHCYKSVNAESAVARGAENAQPRTHRLVGRSILLALLISRIFLLWLLCMKRAKQFDSHRAEEGVCKVYNLSESEEISTCRCIPLDYFKWMLPSIKNSIHFRIVTKID